jgi:hypothetical protein
LPVLTSQNVLADDGDNGAGNQVEPIELLIKFDIAGTPSVDNLGAFTVSGPGYATITTSSGEILDNRIPGLETAQLNGAEIAFQESQDGDHPAIQRFTCLASSCTFTFNDGSVLEADPDVPLDGRMVTAGLWGLVDNGNLDFSMPGVFPQRILGCGGLVGTKGPLKDTVGSVCFNGVFNVPGDIMDNPNAMLTGSSNCTITLHTPVIPPEM